MSIPYRILRAGLELSMSTADVKDKYSILVESKFLRKGHVLSFHFDVHLHHLSLSGQSEV